MVDLYGTRAAKETINPPKLVKIINHKSEIKKKMYVFLLNSGSCGRESGGIDPHAMREAGMWGQMVQDLPYTRIDMIHSIPPWHVR